MDFIISKDTPLKPLDKHWLFCVGSCHAPLAHRVDYLEQLKYVHDELGFERVRFHGIFNDDMQVGMTLRNVLPVPSAKNFRQFSFYQVSRVYDNILKTGMRPFVELGFMPKILASGKRKCPFSYKGNITMPKSLDEWADFITQFLKFLIDRYGLDEVRQWYFEVWNEPNLIAFFKGKKEDYFKLYETTAQAIKAVDPAIAVGGPSTANCAWIDDFVKFCKEKNIPCDFVSTHQYAGDPLGHVLPVGKMVGAFLKRLKTMRRSSGTVLEGARIALPDESEAITDRNIFIKNAEAIKPEAQGAPLFYTEWNVSAANTAYINDTRRAASYAVRTVLAAEGIINKTSWWSFSDIFEEIQFFPEPFSGQFGLITIYGIPKPSFWAFKILAMLGPERYALEKRPDDEIELAAFKKGDSTQLLVYRQNFIAEKGAPESFTVTVGRETQSASVYKIDEEHGNPLALWQAMGSPPYLKPAEVEDIKRRSAMEKEDLPFVCENGKTTVRGALHNNDVWLIELV